MADNKNNNDLNGREESFKLTPSATQKLLTYLVLIVGALISLVPFVWMMSTSVMSLGEALGVAFFPSELHFENYVEAWQRARFSEYFMNSIIITAITLARRISGRLRL